MDALQGASIERTPSSYGEAPKKATPHSGLFVQEEKIEVSRFLSGIALFSNANIAASRILDAIVSYEEFRVGFRVVELFRNQVLWREGQRVQPGLYFVYSGELTLKREHVVELKTSRKEDDDTTAEDNSPGGRHVEVGRCNSGDALGNEALLGMREYKDTTRANSTSAVIIFVPADLFEPTGRFSDAAEGLVQDLRLWMESRNLRFSAMTSMFETVDPFAGGPDPSGLIRSTAKGPPRGWAARDKNTIRLAAEPPKRYFKGHTAQVVFSGQRGFIPGEVPYVDVFKLNTDPKIALKFINVGHPKRFRKGMYSEEAPKSVLPESRVTDLYRRLWKDCSKEMLKLLLDLHSATAESTDATTQVCAPSSSWLLCEVLLTSSGWQRAIRSAPTGTRSPGILRTPRTPRSPRSPDSLSQAPKVVPRIDIGRVSSIRSDAVLSDRPTTAPARSRGQLLDTGPLLFLQRPMTSRGHQSTSKYLPRRPIQMN